MIVTSPEFFSRAAYRSKVKSPFEVTVSALRALGARADTTPFSAGLVGRLGQPLYGHQAPNGWPERRSAWINTGAILNRINLGIVVASGRVPGRHSVAWPPFAELVNAPRAAQVDSVIDVVPDGTGIAGDAGDPGQRQQPAHGARRRGLDEAGR